MRRFSVSELLLATALIAIGLAVAQSEGCGARYAMIEALCFTSDDTRILTTKLTCRDARTPFKSYKADVGRTVSWLGAHDGANCGIVQQDFIPGNRGPAFELWRRGRTTALCRPSDDHVALSSFGGGNVTLNVAAARPKVIHVQHSIFNVAHSKSGRFLAASGRYEVSVVDTVSDSVVMQAQADDLPFFHASLIAFANDEKSIVLASESGVHVWDVASSTQCSTVIEGDQLWINAITAVSDNELVICSDNWVRRYKFDGQVIDTLSERGTYLCCIAGDGNSLATASEGELSIYDLNSNSVRRTFPFPGMTALALSSSGDELAVGDYHGRVSLIDTVTGEQLWCSNPPGRYRWPWTLPAALLVPWTCVAWRVFRRRL